jgi:SEC-C motif-containing protein
VIKKCYCGLYSAYEDCCGKFIDGLDKPKTPEQLMRSRYSAYVQGKVDYIADTMLGNALQGFEKNSSKQWADGVIWLKLDVIKSFNESNERGFVEFSAKFMRKNNKLLEIHEVSEFNYIGNKWYYTDGKNLAPINKFANRIIPNNCLCPCGSGKKFKSCHFG